MRNSIPPMADVAFDLLGERVPSGYAFALWGEIARHLPWIEEEDMAGVLPLRGLEGRDGIWLAKRSKLVLRLPEEKAQAAHALSGQALELGPDVLGVGKAWQRALQPFTTLHAQLVEGHESEDVFLGTVAAALDELDVACSWICGMRGTISDAENTVSGYSLVLHDLKPEDSLIVQRAGLGQGRRFGCGVFVPFKTISGLE
jgi:CRISPR-associated protein Cas6